MAVAMYFLHWFFVLSAIAFSWRRSRSFLHSHFIFTVIICVPLIDFLVRGYDDRNLEYIDEASIFDFQLIILAILTVIILLTSLVRSRQAETRIRNSSMYLHVGSKIHIMILILVVGLVLADAFKRFSAVDWSTSEVLRQSLMPRGQRDWDQIQYAGNFLFAITTILLPLAGIAAGYLMTFGGFLLRVIAFLLMIFILLALVTNGSRTPVLIVLASAGTFGYLQHRTVIGRLIAISVTAGAVALTTSLMYLYRSYGLVSDRFQNIPEFRLIYHMDDSYYRAIFAYDHASGTSAFWDPAVFFYSIIVNPIPRAIWPNKPLLTTDFYDGYKLDYVTNLFLGEMVAMFGVYGTLVFSPIIGFFLYLILFKAQKIIAMPMGIAAYLLFALYVYMCTRSLMNLTHFLYLPAFTLITVRLLNRLQRRSTQKQVLRQPKRYSPCDRTARC